MAGRWGAVGQGGYGCGTAGPARPVRPGRHCAPLLPEVARTPAPAELNCSRSVRSLALVDQNLDLVDQNLDLVVKNLGPVERNPVRFGHIPDSRSCGFVGSNRSVARTPG